MRFADIFSLAFRTVRGNKLRTALTVAIIAFGIMALVGIITAIEAMRQKLTESFSAMGSNGFAIRYKERNIRFGGGGGDELKKEKKGAQKEKKSQLGKFITWQEAERFKQNYQFPSTVSIATSSNRNSTVNWLEKKTNPNVRVMGTDENYVVLNGYEFEFGRNFTASDIESGRSVCVLGREVAKRLFGENVERAMDKIIRVNSYSYRVIGILKAKGSTLGMSWDNVVLKGYNNARRIYGESSYTISIKVNDLPLIDAAVGEAKGSFRPIRKLAVTEADNFVVDKSDSIVEMAMNSLGVLTVSAMAVGLITLIGAAIGLMNIMLVAVTERTKEVGLIKAIGGQQRTVRRQFLMESVIISLMGAFFGIILGILVGNLFAIVLGTGFVVPWAWVFYGIIICTVVGILAGSYPARKAGKLNPIEALRYE